MELVECIITAHQYTSIHVRNATNFRLTLGHFQTFGSGSGGLARGRAWLAAAIHLAPKWYHLQASRGLKIFGPEIVFCYKAHKSWSRIGFRLTPSLIAVTKVSLNFWKLVRFDSFLCSPANQFWPPPPSGCPPLVKHGGAEAGLGLSHLVSHSSVLSERQFQAGWRPRPAMAGFRQLWPAIASEWPAMAGRP